MKTGHFGKFNKKVGSELLKVQLHLKNVLFFCLVPGMMVIVCVAFVASVRHNKQ